MKNKNIFHKEEEYQFNIDQVLDDIKLKEIKEKLKTKNKDVTILSFTIKGNKDFLYKATLKYIIENKYKEATIKTYVLYTRGFYLR